MLRILLLIFLMIPLLTLAGPHIIQIKSVQSFPAKIPASSIVTAKFEVMNIAWIPLSVVDKSNFPQGSGLSILSSDCGHPFKPKESCHIELQLKAPTTPQIITTQLIETSTPSPDLSDTVSSPIVIEITKALENFTITAMADTGGSVLPSGAQTVKEGSNLTFTAMPDINYTVKQWLVDNVVSQEGGNTFVLNNIKSNHSVKVTFVKGQEGNNTLIIGGRNLSPSEHTPAIIVSYDKGQSWEAGNTNNLPNNVNFSRLSCAGKGNSITCIAPYADNQIVLSNDGGKTWVIKQLGSEFSYASVFTRCTGEGDGIICIAGPLIKEGLHYMASSQDAGKNWQIIRLNDYPDNPAEPPDVHTTTINTASCGGSGQKAICFLGGEDYHYFSDEMHYRTYPLEVYSEDGGKSWTSSVGSGITTSVNTSACGNNKDHPVCQFGGSGYDYPGFYAFSERLKDGGWSGGYYESTFGNPKILTISCSSDKNALCFLGGQYISIFNDQVDTYYNGYFQSACSGDTQNGFCITNAESGLRIWRANGSIDYPEVTGEIHTMKCAGEDTKTFCTLLQKNNTLLYSSDGAKTWVTRKVPPMELGSLQVIPGS